MVLFLSDNVIYVFLLLWLRVLIVCLCLTILTEVFPCFFLSCKANARVKPAKTGHGPHSSWFLCCSMYCLFCVVLCIVCLCICVLNYGHRVATQLQLNISYITETTLTAGRSGARIPSRAGYFSLPKSSEPALGLSFPKKKQQGHGIDHSFQYCRF